MKPILFSTPMVQAILDGRKTMTRRICNIPDGWEYNGWGRITSKHPKQGKLGIFIRKQDGDFVQSDIITAKYQVGDVLWVRETWQEVITKDGMYLKFVYKTDGGNYKWKPSIFMPKEACRIFLRVTNVRVERLQDISTEDAIKEGIKKLSHVTDCNDKEVYLNYLQPVMGGCTDPIYSFYTLWNSINGKGAWEANPYVLVYEFERIEKPN